MKIRFLILSVISLLMLSACSSDINEYKGTAPTLDIKNYFTGDIVAWGMLQDYTDKVTRRFCVEINGSWQGRNGLLKETFYWNDGEISHRNWQLNKQTDGKYTGTAEDVNGVAKGQQQGFAFNWKYALQVPIGDSSYSFDIDDWMYQLDQYRVINKSKMYKLGIHVADITIFFNKKTSSKKCDLNPN
ncbi:DUF3833 domain-containing protein [Parashewanella curva]|uniref:DUF3833 domain-containing protein n=1 Tax=Parashewanella curva TaxID=2338552 RepID=A0A3L8Q1Q7_9GAMM|nr:DUF3833 domain-containing protein [Parashewanella curva]RLV61617.1 DUF3833 domain-containing protein [Parashewanella curva]